MGERHDLGPLVQQLEQGRHDPLDAGGVRDLAVLHRHVQVDPHQHRLAGRIEIVEGADPAMAGAQSLPSNAATSLMRQEKPHSLSYQEATRASLPPSTLVALRSTVELWLSWLKSTETSGAS